MLNLEQLENREMRLLYDGLMQLNYGKYDSKDRECIIKLKNELRREADKRPCEVKAVWNTYEEVEGEWRLKQ